MTTFVDTTTLITAAFMNAVATVVEAAGPIAIAAVTPAADTFAYYTSAAAAASTPLTAFARTILDDANAAAVRTTLGLGTAATTAATAYATAAQGALADTAVQPANPAFTGTATFNTTYFVQRSDGHSGFGYSGAPEVFTANRRYVSIQGDGTGTSDGCGVLQFRSNSPEGTNVIGAIEWIDPNNTSGNKRLGYIAQVVSGATVNNRGSYMSFATRADAGAAAAERMRITSSGQVLIGTTVAYSAKLSIGDATEGIQTFMRGTGGTNNETALWMYTGSTGGTGVNLETDTLSCPGGTALRVTGYYATAQNSALAITNTHFLVSPAGNPTVLYGSNTWATIGMAPTASEATLCLLHDAGGGGLGYTNELRFRSTSPPALPYAVGKLTFWNSTDEIASIVAGATGTADAGNIDFYTQPAAGSPTQRVRLHDNGFLSLGTYHTKNTGTRAYLTVSANATGIVAPAASTVAQLIGADGSSGTSMTIDSYGGLPIIFFRRCNTGIAAPTAPAADDVVGSVAVRPYNGTSWETGSRASMNQVASENWTSTTVGTYLSFSTTLTGTTTTSQKMRLWSHGGLAVCSGTMPSLGTSTLLAVSNNTSAMSVPSNTVYVAAADGVATTITQDSAAAVCTLLFRRASNTLASPTALAANDNIGAVSGRGYGATGYSSSSRVNMGFYAGEAWTDTAQGTYITFSTTALTTTTLTEQMRIAANGNITLTSKLISYNGTTLAGGGMAVIVARSTLTNQSAAIAATTIYAVPAAGEGHYRVSWVATCTTAATTSSVLGGATTTGFQLVYTNPTDSVVKTSNPVNVNNSTNSAANSTGTSVSGNFNAWCKASTNLQYQFGYTSVGATAMVYDMSIVVEFLGA